MQHPVFISTLDVFKIGIGPSSSHTVGPMKAANAFLEKMAIGASPGSRIRCTLKGSLAYTGKGHATDNAVVLGLNGYDPHNLTDIDMDALLAELWQQNSIQNLANETILFSPTEDIIFDRGEPLPQHSNGMIFEVIDPAGDVFYTETYFSIGGGFITRVRNIENIVAPQEMETARDIPFPFGSGEKMIRMSRESGMSVAQLKAANEREYQTPQALRDGLDAVWKAMRTSVERGLNCEGLLPGGIRVERRAKNLHDQLLDRPETANVTDWLCAYAMAVSEENAAGHMVVTAPTNGAAGVIPAVLYYLVVHHGIEQEDVREFLLVAGAIGGLIKLKSSISGAEVGCQGEVGSAASMAAAGLCAVRGGNAEQVENAAEIALEHHLGMTCDPVQGLVQVPCVERNGFGAIKAYTAASLAKRGTGRHFMSLDNCMAAMKQTGLEMSEKFKETSLGGLAVSNTEC